MSHDPITRCAVYPSLGCARLGNCEGTAPDEWFLGPEVPNVYPTPPGGYKKDGKIKRQGARFRVYARDDDGNVRELTLDCDDVADMVWTVELANRKASWYEYNNAMDLPEDAPPISSKQRNNNQIENRETLQITPAPGHVSRDQAGSGPMIGQFMGVDVTLGELLRDNAGRLIVLGGFGRSASVEPSNPIQNFSNNNAWFDDIADGVVRCKVTFVDGNVLEAEPGWVTSAPPDFGPGIEPLVTLWDLMRGVAVDAGWLKAPETPSFTEEIWPTLRRLAQMQWVSESANLRYGWQSEFNFFSPELIAMLADPESEAGAVKRRQIFHALRSPAYTTDDDPPIPVASAEDDEIEEHPLFPNDQQIPLMLGDGIDYPGSPRQWFAIPKLQYNAMAKWANGDFTDDWDPEAIANRPREIDDYPVAAQPGLLTKAALDPVFGGAFHPGVELTWPMRHKRLYSGPFRLAVADGPTRQNFGYLLTKEIAMGPDGPLGPVAPGDLTRWMGLPWQSDAASCQSVYLPQDFPIPVWWPANLPVDVLPETNYDLMNDRRQPDAQRVRFFDSRRGWSRGVGAVGYHAEGGYTQAMIHMVNDWWRMGILEERPGPDDLDVPKVQYVETGRDELSG